MTAPAAGRRRRRRGRGRPSPPARRACARARGPGFALVDGHPGHAPGAGQVPVQRVDPCTRAPSSSTDTATGIRATACTRRTALFCSRAVALPPRKIPPTWVARTVSTTASGSAASTPTTSRCARRSRGATRATIRAQATTRSRSSCEPTGAAGTGAATAAGCGAASGRTAMTIPAATSPTSTPASRGLAERARVRAGGRTSTQSWRTGSKVPQPARSTHTGTRNSPGGMRNSRGRCATDANRGSGQRRHPLTLADGAGRGAVAERAAAELLAAVRGRASRDRSGPVGTIPVGLMSSAPRSSAA